MTQVQTHDNLVMDDVESLRSTTSKDNNNNGVTRCNPSWKCQRTNKNDAKVEWMSTLSMVYSSVFLIALTAITYYYYDQETTGDEIMNEHELQSIRHLQQQITGESEVGATHLMGFVHRFVHRRAVSASFRSAENKTLFPLDSSDISGIIFAIVGLMIAGGSGIGGGGILVPIFILVMGFSPKHAIPLSNVTIVGGAIANNIINSHLRHPLADRPLVDWDLMLNMVPLTLLGTLIGALLNKLLPELILTILLVLLLAVIAYTTMKKAISLYQKETDEMIALTCSDRQLTSSERQALLESVRDVQSDKPVVTNIDDGDSNKLTSFQSYQSIRTGAIDETKPNDDLKKILEEERHVPVGNLILLIVTLLIVLIVNVLKGGGAFPSPLGIECGSAGFWYANGFLAIWTIGVTIYLRWYLVKRYYRKKACNYQYVEGDIEWDEKVCILFPLFCGATGVFAGMFGIGGGIMTGPLLLAMGVHPEVNSATSAARILFTSLTALTSFLVFGLVIPDYAILFFIIGFIATYIGHEVLFYYMKKFNRTSLIAFSIGLVVLISTFLMTIQALASFVSGNYGRSHGICSSS